MLVSKVFYRRDSILTLVFINDNLCSVYAISNFFPHFYLNPRSVPIWFAVLHYFVFCEAGLHHSFLSTFYVE